MARIIQITATSHRLYALDAVGNVYIYDPVDKDKSFHSDIAMIWKKLPVPDMEESNV